MANKTSGKTRRSFGQRPLTNKKIVTPNQSQSITLQPNLSPPNLMKPEESLPRMMAYEQEKSEAFTYITQIRIDAQLFESLNNAVESAIFGGNYSIQSASHFVREALKEHASGTPLKVAHQNGSKKSLSLRLNEQLKNFWDTLPKGHRNNILERAIRTKLLSYQI
jgi:hypothetical protein